MKISTMEQVYLFGPSIKVFEELLGVDYEGRCLLLFSTQLRTTRSDQPTLQNMGKAQNQLS